MIYSRFFLTGVLLRADNADNRQNKWKEGAMEVWGKYKVAVILFGFVMFGFVGSILFPQPPAARPVIPPATVTFDEIRGATRKMASENWDAYSATLPGQGTAGTGWVLEVSHNWRSGYTAHLAPLPPLPFFTGTSRILVDGLSKWQVGGLVRGKKVSYAGQITSAFKIENYLIVRMNPGKVTAF
jgi:hypothetical protein